MGAIARHLDAAIAELFPGWGARRAKARHIRNAYEAANPSRLRRAKGDDSSGNTVVALAGPAMRAQGRHLDQNHDLATGILNTLVNNIVGPTGIGVHPQPLGRDGRVHEPTRAALAAMWRQFSRRPEVTGLMSRSQAERLVCRTWLRDGEVLGHFVQGTLPGLVHSSPLPLSMEYLEPDYLPMDANDPSRGIVQGVECNAWGRVRAYHIHKQHPGDMTRLSIMLDTKRVPASEILHLAMRTRLHQARGVSVFYAVLQRLEDIKDYEDSERIAARIAAAIALQIRQDPDTPGGVVQQQGNRNTAGQYRMAPGTVYDNLPPGAYAEIVESKRPSQLLSPFRDAMLRAVAAGTYVSYSDAARDYNGTYSAQRQEMNVCQIGYEVLQDEFICGHTAPVYERAVQLAVVSGLIPIAPDLNVATIANAEYRGPVMPQIDPNKESQAAERWMRMGVQSLDQARRDYGNDPERTEQQIADERARHGKAGLVFTSNAANDKGPAPAAQPAVDDDEE